MESCGVSMSIGVILRYLRTLLFFRPPHASID